MRGIAIRAVLATIAGVVLTAPAIEAQEVTYFGSVQYWTGPYIFTERTHSVWVSNGLDLRAGRVDVSVSVPVAIQNSLAITTVGSVPIPTGGPDHDAVRDRDPGHDVPMKRKAGNGGNGVGSQHGSSGSGVPVLAAEVDSVAAPGDYETQIADPMVTGSVEVYRGDGAVRSLELEGFAKVPVADLDSGVGTGEWDYGAGTAVALAAGRTLVFGDLSYWRYGDLPDLELKDGLSFGAGIGRPIGDRWSVLASVSGSQEIIEGVDPYAAVTLAGGYLVGSAHSVNVGIGFGLTESAADVSLYMGWNVGLTPAVR